jgi:hypothetical protein
MRSRRPFCAELAQENAEPLFATASHLEHWLLVEYRGLWAHDPLPGSTLGDEVKTHLRRQLAALPRARLLFIRRPDRRRERGVAVFFGTTKERDRRFFGLELERYEDLLEFDVAAALADGERGATLNHPLLIVCTHGKRDRCCAKYGRPLYDALREEADAEWVWQSTHVGGDRFAGNLVCFPHGLYFGRVERLELGPLLDELLGGRIYLAPFRGSCCYSFPAQAAERIVRAATGLTGMDDLRLVAAERSGDGCWDVAFLAEPTGETHEVEVVAELGDPTYLTCNAETLKRPRRYAATRHRVRAIR